LDFLRQLPFEQLREAPEAQERLFEQLAVAGNSRRNYRWALNGFMGWCEEQDWLEMEHGGNADVRGPGNKSASSQPRLFLYPLVYQSTYTA
jgi:hypothetical protein